MHRSFSLLVACCLCLFLAGCNSNDAPALGDWTRNTNELTLTEELRVSETENYFIGSIEDFDVTTDGRMVVLDEEATHVLKVLRPDGTLLDTLGRPGQGPGEFQDPATVEVARGDSVYVFDQDLNRLTVFAPLPSATVARSAVITSTKDHVVGVQVLDDRLAAELTPGYTRKEGLYRPSPNTWYTIEGTTASGDSLLSTQRQRIATSFEGQGAMIGNLPFGRATQVTVGPEGRLYHGVTDSLRIHATSLDGTTETVASVPAAPVPVTEAERDSTLTDFPSTLRRLIAPDLPETKPAFTDLIVAPTGRLWVRRPTEGREPETVSWWVLNPDTKTIHEIQLPADVSLEVVRDETVYGTTTTERGAPAVVRYQIESG